MKKYMIGIDLGTTNSEVAVIENGKPKLLKIDGSPIMPSVISFDQEGNILVGKPAVNNALLAPENSISLIKRKMGRSELILLNGKDYTPPMLSSLILTRLKLAAEEYYGEPVTQAVITVPAFFDEKQREATKEAAELAGLEVLRLLNEPTSAALSYALGQKKEEVCLVYDLGGGTFDVSIVDLSRDVMEVRSSHGDTELGGADFDKLIYEKIRRSFLDKHGIDISSNPISKIRIMNAAEAAKIRLSTESSAEILEEFIYQQEGIGLHLHYTITRTEFEAMVRPIIEQTLQSVTTALNQASCLPSALDRVILVGGSTQIPLVAQLLQKQLHLVPQTWVNPATVVAQGAAIEAANLCGEKIGAIMVDITPHSLGVEATDNSYEPINNILIRRNTPLPAIASQIFYKGSSETKRVVISAHQGESENLDLCRFLGRFELTGLTEKSDPEILVKFELDRNGLLHVTAVEVASGKSCSKVMKRMHGSGVQKKNLADLNNARILIPQEVIRDTGYAYDHDENDHDDEEDDEEEEDANCNWSSLLDLSGNKEEKEEESLASTQAINANDQVSKLTQQVFQLLTRENLGEMEKQELQRELAALQSGDKEAMERLNNLIYYIE